MSEQGAHCPVVHSGDHNAGDRSSRYDLVVAAAQRHIDEPGNHDEINANLRGELESRLELMFQNRPEVASQKVARGVRSATFAAFFHIAAEPLAQGELPAERADWADYSFHHTDFTCKPTQEFAQRVSASLLDRFCGTNADMLDPDSPLYAYHDLASSLPSLLTEFNTATPPTELHPSYRTDLSHWFILAAEDNAAAQLDVLISAGTACQSQQPGVDADEMAAFALANMDILTQVASVNGRTSANISVREEQPSPGFDFGRKETVVEYETALAEGRPVTATSGVLHVTPDVNWRGSLTPGPWRQPGYCAAYPELSSHLVPDLSFRTITAELTAAATVAEETIYAQWPQ